MPDRIMTCGGNVMADVETTKTVKVTKQIFFSIRRNPFSAKLSTYSQQVYRKLGLNSIVPESSV